jgi:transcriptional antiterminator NusG
LKKWYVVNTYSGHENKVRATMERRIDSFGLKRHFGDISIPTESVIEIKDGKKVPTVQRQFPGYILVNMDMNDDTWRLVRQTPWCHPDRGCRRTSRPPLSARRSSAC